MQIISDNREKVELDKKNLTNKLIQMIHDEIYSCDCGIDFKIDWLDIKTDTTFFPILEVKCPGCKQNHKVISDEMIVEIDKYDYPQAEMMYRCIDEIKKLKKSIKKGKFIF